MENLDEHNHDFINKNTYKISQSNVAEEDYIVNYDQGAFTPPTTNFIGDRRSPEKFEADAQYNFLPLNSVKNNDKQEETEKNKGSLITLPNKPVPLPISVKNDVHIHWDPLTHFYFASLTVVSLFIMFRSLQNSH